MNFILFDGKERNDLLPLTFTRPVSGIRIGILTIREKWEKYLNQSVSYLTQSYLSNKFPIVVQDKNILISGAVIPNQELADQVVALKTNQALIHDNDIIAVNLAANDIPDFDFSKIIDYECIINSKDVHRVARLWDIFSDNGREIENDFLLITKNRDSQQASKTVQIIGDNIFVEEGFKGEYCTINTNDGPVYLGRDTEVMEGALIRGPFALCQHSALKLGAKIYGPTTIGPYCKVGGEVNNSVFQGFANKAHDGFLGNSVIGEWCNIGADSNTSNLKNNYDQVRLWNYLSERFEKTGLQFCGLIMGDHSKCGINTMFNTGTVVGVSANIFGSGFPRNFIPSFAWGGNHGFTEYAFPKACEVASRVFARRGKIFDDTEISILKEIFDQTEQYRKF
ncbi:MAG: glucose-1-phosphate thymidylyltransferase [Bacteroidetes bacterium]|jgi:UDP-N-acetylglucosamine diphosphorylase/glucosamine-1-phosphate N-acetyltransferase|nr:glucose-1-phosphate thymidylyltransferase [Bacteroidota bacterium]